MLEMKIKANVGVITKSDLAYCFHFGYLIRKLIGARCYPDEDPHSISPRDYNGHGTHVASTAVGAVVRNASFYGLAAGTAKSGSPESRLAIYKVCPLNFCSGSAIMAAFDDAIADGVDVLSVSLGASAGEDKDLTKDPISIGAFHAVERGILVVCAGGNDGPTPSSIENDSPWILTVAASTIDRDFQSNLVLGDHSVISVRFPFISKSKMFILQPCYH